MFMLQCGTLSPRHEVLLLVYTENLVAPEDKISGTPRAAIVIGEFLIYEEI